MLDAEGLAHLILYDGDTAKVVLDADVSGDTDGEGVPLISRSHERAGRHLFYILEELEPDFAELRTGALMRTVLRVPSGAIFYYLVEPGLHLYGATYSTHSLDDSGSAQRFDELDERVADAVNELRVSVNYSQWDFGSYLSKKSAAPPAPAPESLSVAPADACHTESESPSADAPDGTAGLLSAALDVNGLHHVAYYSGGTAVCSADIFRHPSLSRYFRVTTPERRREKYARMGELLPGVAQRMNASLSALLEGRLHQIVLDVEQGAVYFHTLPGGRYLMAVTLDQARVAEADRRLGQLGRELSHG
ncbi:hypothetical protein DI272_32095 [Streptomyces sp. Act143]|nr:hypothetical protein DI272_32095 [Streptomyces sp. Act143]